MRTVQKKDSSPRGTQGRSRSPACGMEDSLESMLGRSVQSGWPEGRSVLHAFPGAAVRTPRNCRPRPSACPHFPQTRSRLQGSRGPTQYSPSPPEISRHGIPRKVQQTIWPHLTEEFSGAACLKQIQFVPVNIRQCHGWKSSASGVNLIPFRHQHGQAMAADKTTRPGYHVGFILDDPQTCDPVGTLWVPRSAI